MIFDESSPFEFSTPQTKFSTSFIFKYDFGKSQLNAGCPPIEKYMVSEFVFFTSQFTTNERSFKVYFILSSKWNGYFSSVSGLSFNKKVREFSVLDSKTKSMSLAKPCCES